MASAGKEGHRLQGNNLDALREHPYNEAIPNDQSRPDMRSIDQLLGGDLWNFESYGSMEAELGGVQGFAKESGMEHDSSVIDGN